MAWAFIACFQVDSMYVLPGYLEVGLLEGLHNEDHKDHRRYAWRAV